MAERKRNKEIHFYVTEEERKLIRRKMIESKTKNMGAYLRKMARLSFMPFGASVIG